MRLLRTCSECLARHPGPCSLEMERHRSTNCPEGACIGRSGSCTSENDCRINQREASGQGTARRLRVGCRLRAVYRGGQVHVDTAVREDGEPRRTLSVQPTYGWTCFSPSADVSPMPRTIAPTPRPTPCHLPPSCTSCLDSKGLASSSLQHGLSPILPLPCMAAPRAPELPPGLCPGNPVRPVPTAPPLWLVCLGGGGVRMGWPLPGGWTQRPP
ncbi:hypothetical protein QTO34_019249 [Cnephaeus nilssonii]|uniref:Uncharacterized protein n=1 Tax=Cnephaeus nilssonii TaxID=3371016 RepID=A0AA40LMJ0_CNENI|nr:hypothetical protein QTO34_019249 [Eptesicus nilssonii]